MTDDQLDRLIEAVEDETTGHCAWDLEDPRKIARAFLACIPRIEAEIADELHRANAVGPDPFGGECPNCLTPLSSCICFRETGDIVR